MKRYFGIALALAVASGAWAQDKAGSTAVKPADKGATGAAPAAKSDAKSDTKSDAKSDASVVPGGDAKADASKTPAASTTGAKTVTIHVPSGGEYSAYVQEGAAGPKSIQDKGELDLPAGVKSPTVYVLDKKSGYAARKTVDLASPDMIFASPDFKLVQRVDVKVTGKDNKPIAAGAVMLTDGAKNTQRKMIQSSSQGTATFEFVASGPGKVSVTPDGGNATTKDITIDLPKGETAQAIPMALPEVTAVVEPAAGSGNAPAAANAPAGNAPAANAAANTAAPAPAPTAQPAAPATQPAAQPLPPPSSNDWVGGLISWLIFFGIVGGGVYYAKSRGVTVDMVLKKLGVQPDLQGAGGTNLSGANLASGVQAPGPAPAPPPAVADPNQCPYCGQMKDAAGGCACTVTPGAAAASPSFSAAPSGSGPRLVGMGGTYMGSVFPISGMAVIGREPTNPIPLDRDTTTSRRHAQISAEGGTYRLQDLGSSNGTFVNGARVTETVLSPGDEVSIGGTRFRFEA